MTQLELRAPHGTAADGDRARRVARAADGVVASYIHDIERNARGRSRARTSRVRLGTTPRVRSGTVRSDERDHANLDRLQNL
jgi:hypothetical protein